MNIARPPGGFRIIVKDDVETYVRSEAIENPQVTRHWADILDRIKITALKEGDPVPGCSPPRFFYLALGAPRFRVPNVRLVYEVFSDTLTVKSAVMDYDDH